MKKVILNIAYELNLLSFVIYPISFIYFGCQTDYLQTPWSAFKVISLIVWEIIGIGNLTLLIGNLVIWNKHDKSSKGLLLLLFFNWLYCPRYYKKAKKN